MKAILLAALSLMSVSAFAMPKVGDSVTYKIITNGMTLSQKIELTAYNASTDSFTQTETTTYQGQTQKEVNTVAAEEMINDQTADMMITYCESQMGGKLQTITVTAGTFKACSVFDPATQSQVWMGKVPFGMIKLQGSQVSAELMSFTNGK